MADIDGVKPVYPTPLPRRIEKGDPRQDKGRSKPPPARPPQDRPEGDGDKPQVDEYV